MGGGLSESGKTREVILTAFLGVLGILGTGWIGWVSMTLVSFKSDLAVIKYQLGVQEPPAKVSLLRPPELAVSPRLSVPLLKLPKSLSVTKESADESEETSTSTPNR